MPPVPAVPAAQPPAPAPLKPIFVADKVRFGVTGSSTGPAMAFGFADAAGNELPPVILTNDHGGISTAMLEEFQRVFGQVAPPVEPEETPDVRCRGGCGQRIFGPLIERGACLVCEPA